MRSAPLWDSAEIGFSAALLIVLLAILYRIYLLTEHFLYQMVLLHAGTATAQAETIPYIKEPA